MASAVGRQQTSCLEHATAEKRYLVGGILKRSATLGASTLLQSHLHAVVLVVPLPEGGGINLHDGILHQGLRPHLQHNPPRSTIAASSVQIYCKDIAINPIHAVSEYQKDAGSCVLLHLHSRGGTSGEAIATTLQMVHICDRQQSAHLCKMEIQAGSSLDS